MNCQEARNWISPYLDSELDPTKTFEVSRHPEQCDECRDRFEREAHADRLIADSLKSCAPFVDWHSLAESISRPAVHSFSRHPGRWMLAAAACIAFIVIGLSEWSQPTLAGSSVAWAVDELHGMSPEGKAFACDGNSQFCAKSFDEMCCSVLKKRIELHLKDGPAKNHPIELVSARTRACSKGLGSVELQLNCCGKPVLLTIARCRDSAELRGVENDLRRADLLTAVHRAHNNSYYATACKADDCVILGVSPDHSVESIVKGIRLASLN